MKIRQNTSGNSPITFVTHERFVILFFLPSCCVNSLLGSLSNNVFERRTSTGSGPFSFFDGGFAQILSQIASITVKKLRNTNFISSRHVKRENTSLPVDVRRSKTSLLKLPINSNIPRKLIASDRGQGRMVVKKQIRTPKATGKGTTKMCNLFR